MSDLGVPLGFAVAAFLGFAVAAFLGFGAGGLGSGVAALGSGVAALGSGVAALGSGVAALGSGVAGSGIAAFGFGVATLAPLVVLQPIDDCGDEQNWSFKKDKQCHMSRLWVKYDEFDCIFTNLLFFGIRLVLVRFQNELVALRSRPSVTNKFTQRKS